MNIGMLIKKVVFVIFICAVCLKSAVGSLIQASQCENITNHAELKFYQKRTDVPEKADKCFSIRLPDSQNEIVLVFYNFNLLNSDTVVLYGVGKGNATWQRIFAPFRGQRAAFAVFSSQSSLLLHLQTSNETGFARHFKAKYYVNECKYEEEQISFSGIFSSPIYLKGRKRLLSCSFSFGFIGSSQRLHKFVLDTVRNNVTDGNLTVTGSENSNGIYEAGTFPSRIFSSSRLDLLLVINPVVPSQQFVASFQLATAACSGVVPVTDKVSFRLPDALIPNDGTSSQARCHWLVRGPPNSVVRLSFSLGLEFGPRDTLMVGRPLSFDVHHITATNRHLYAGSEITSTTNELWVSFQSPNVSPNTNLNVTASLASEKGGRLLRNAGNFTLLDGDLLLEVEPQSRVLLFLPRNPPRSAVLHFYSDFDSSSRPFLNLSASTPLDSVVSPTSRMKLVSQGSISASFVPADKGCHQVSQGKEGLYSLQKSCGRCTWMILPWNASRSWVELHFLQLDLGHGDEVLLERLDGNLSHVATLRAGTLAGPIRSPTGSGLLLTTTSQNCTLSLQGTFIFRSACGTSRRLTRSARDTEVLSPLFPESYPLGSYCQWNFYSASGGLFLLNVHRLQLAHLNHTLEIGTKLNPHGYSLLEKSNANLTFHAPWVFIPTVQHISSSSFWIKVTLLDCGSVLEGSSGSVRVPNGSLLCVWLLDVSATLPATGVTFVSLATASNTKHLSVRHWDEDKVAKTQELRSGSELLISGDLGTVALIYNRTSPSPEDSEVWVSYAFRVCKETMVCRVGQARCMEKSWVCNGVDECDDGRDEIECSPSANLTSTVDPGSTALQPNALVNDSSLSLVHVLLYVAGAIILGASVPSFVYCCLLKRRGQQDHQKYHSRWAMVMNGHGGSGESL